MKHVFVTASALALVAALGACKQSEPADSTTTEAPAATGIDGTWVGQLDSVKYTGKPIELSLKDGTYTCSSCVPSLTVPADGAYHAVTGRDYADEISVKVDSPTQVTIASKKGGAEMGSTVYTVSADGKTLTQNFTDTSVKNAPAVTGSRTLTRVGEAPAGAHAMSGQWQLAKYDKLSDEGLTVSYESTPDSLKMTSPDGTSFDAKTDGTDTPIVGDPAGATVAVTKPAENTWHFVYKVGDKVSSETDMTLDGDTTHYKNVNADTGNTMEYDAKRK